MDTIPENINDQAYIEFYKALLEQQSNNYSLFLAALFGLTTILLLIVGGLTWYWNKIAAQRFIMAEMEKLAGEQKKVLEKELNALLEKRIDKLSKSSKEDIIAVHLSLYTHMGDYYLETSNYFLGLTISIGIISLSSKLDRPRTLRLGIDLAIKNLNMAKEKGISNLDKEEIQLLKEAISKIPPILEREKVELMGLLAQFKEEEEISTS